MTDKKSAGHPPIEADGANPPVTDPGATARSPKAHKAGTPKAETQKVDAVKAEGALVAVRRAKIATLRAADRSAFINDIDASDRIMLGELRRRVASASLIEAEPGSERYDAEKVTALLGEASLHVLGRMLIRRGFGKVAFLRLRDDSGEIQLFVKEEELGADFSALDEIDMADHIEAWGPVVVTKTGELSILVRKLRLVTKALRPLPDKWHGLSDIELRYRRRYVDMVANPDVATALRSRSIIIQGLRQFLDQRAFLEVETPTLHQVVGGAAAHPFTTHHNTLDLNLFLRIAPELYLKRMLVGGFERVYEIGRCYRNEGISTRHNPEFTMLEFYQAYATYQTLMPLAEELFRSVDAYLAARLLELGLGETYHAWVSARPFTLNEPFARVPMREAVERALERAEIPVAEVWDKLDQIARRVDAAPEVEQRAAESVKSWATRSARARKVDWGNLRKALAGCESAGERLFAAYEYLAEPFLSEDYRTLDGLKSLPVFILDYPAEVSPLARRKDTDPTLTDRFELFVDGIERCNAFSELNDPDDQAARFQAQVDKKGKGHAETMDYDADYIRALEHGMPPAAGFGLGVDRFVMLLTGQTSIRDVIAFPLLRPEAAS